MLLGELLYERREYPAAYKWSSAAADRGLRRARLNLAQMKFDGRGTFVDARGALDLLKQSLPSNVPTAEDQHRALDLMRALPSGAMAPGR
jgi:TPR repeat protein